MSEWDVDAAKRRDFRHSKGAPEEPRHRSKRTQSCKKSPDKIHTFETKEEGWPDMGLVWVECRCVFCGKRDLSIKK